MHIVIDHSYCKKPDENVGMIKEKWYVKCAVPNSVIEIKEYHCRYMLPKNVKDASKWTSILKLPKPVNIQSHVCSQHFCTKDFFIGSNINKLFKLTLRTSYIFFLLCITETDQGKRLLKPKALPSLAPIIEIVTIKAEIQTSLAIEIPSPQYATEIFNDNENIHGRSFCDNGQQCNIYESVSNAVFDITDMLRTDKELS